MTLATTTTELPESAPQALSASITIGPRDRRCRYWAKVVRAGTSLPAPSAVEGAASIPGPYAPHGEEELFAGDTLIEGEEIHHRKARGWTYQVAIVSPDGTPVYIQPDAALKATLKAGGLPARLLPGSGDVAACVRVVHAHRLGLLLK